MDGIMDGIKLYPLKQINVPKGDVYHALKSTDADYIGFGEVYFSWIEHGQVKGWKRHNRMTLNIIVPVGEIKFVIYDDRKNSTTYGTFEEIVLSAAFNYQRLVISPGLWMAFCGVAEGESMLMDVIPELHDTKETDRKELLEIPYVF